MAHVTRIADIRTALPPRGAAVRDININRYGLVISRSGRECLVKFIDGSYRKVYASQLEVVKRVRTVY